jgi:hypothetical protein
MADAPPIRPWYVSQALGSVSQLHAVLQDLTEAEVAACLDLEAATQRRRSVLRRLIGRAVRLRAAQLQQHYLAHY